MYATVPNAVPGLGAGVSVPDMVMPSPGFVASPGEVSLQAEIQNLGVAAVRRCLAGLMSGE